jgi:hypothetical protein
MKLNSARNQPFSLPEPYRGLYYLGVGVFGMPSEAVLGKGPLPEWHLVPDLRAYRARERQACDMPAEGQLHMKSADGSYENTRSRRLL